MRGVDGYNSVGEDKWMDFRETQDITLTGLDKGGEKDRIKTTT